MGYQSSSHACEEVNTLANKVYVFTVSQQAIIDHVFCCLVEGLQCVSAFPLIEFPQSLLLYSLRA